MLDIKISVEAVSELITRSEAKKHCLITHTDDDTYIDALITQCRKAIENYCSVKIGTQTLIVTADLCGYEETILPYGPNQSVSEVTYKNGTSYSTATLNTDYEIDGQFQKTFIPYFDARYKITYTTGYTSLPDDLKLAILNEIAYRYTHRGEEQEFKRISEEARKLAQPYKVFSWV